MKILEIWGRGEGNASQTCNTPTLRLESLNATKDTRSQRVEHQKQHRLIEIPGVKREHIVNFTSDMSRVRQNYNKHR